MFRTFGRLLRFVGANPQDLFLFHPADLTGLLELAWDRRAVVGNLGGPLHRSDLNRFTDTWFGRPAMTAPAPAPPGQPNIAPLLAVLGSGIRTSRGAVPVIWDHLIYAYMIENTRAVEIFRRVVHEFTHGEKLGLPSVETQQWLRNTEELFFRAASPFYVPALRSDVRPDPDATWRNAFFRLLGMDLNHGTGDDKAYAYVRPDAANREFVATFEELLREVWVGIINAGNTSGSKATDDAKLADLARKLNEMLTSRRVNGTLSREEFACVAMMSWFHQTLDVDNAPVVRDLRAQAASAEQRLFKIAQQVGLPAHGLSGSYFEIAESISLILLMIEAGAFATPGSVAALYTPGTLTEALTRKVITHWSIITGRDVKAGKVAPSEAPRRSA